MVRIVDRRFDSKKKSSVNRQRFLDRYRGQIRKAVADAIAKRGIRDLESGEKIGIPAKDISEPQFGLGAGGVRQRVHPGNDQFAAGDRIERPQGGGAGGGSQGSPDGEGIDEFVFTISRDEFLDIFFDDLELPNLVKTQLARIDEYKRVRAGYTQTGVPANISIVRSMRGAAGRRVAFAAPYLKAIRALEDELQQRLDDDPDETRPEVVDLRAQIGRLRARIERIPFIDTFDLRFANRVRQPKPSTQAVMFCLMDVSGSMDEEKKQVAKRFFMLLYLFLTRSYDHIDVVFIRHHTQAEEVDEDQFFHSRETGGTVVSSALDLMYTVIRQRYASSAWNIYGAQASDGDNWDSDSPRCGEILGEQILPLVQYFAYVEITEGEPQNLWRTYEGLLGRHTDRFAIQRIAGVKDIYPVFRELFRKRLA
jgi:hypothetical protein